MTQWIDLNADLGEDETEAGISRDIAIMQTVSSCNIACGGHAGTAPVMRKMLEAAQLHDVHAGAHPSYPDRQNFGRKSMAIEPDKLAESLRNQITQLEDIAAEMGMKLSHLKPHGALYNDAQDDDDLARLLTSLATEFNLSLVSMAGSAVERSAQFAGINFIAEAFIDRRYTGHGRLVPRSEAGAVIEQEADRMAQGLALAKGQTITSLDGEQIRVTADSLCLHSDSEGALQSARAMRRKLEDSGFSIGHAPR